jgi:hypothetical protein
MSEARLASGRNTRLTALVRLGGVMRKVASAGQAQVRGRR